MIFLGIDPGLEGALAFCEPLPLFKEWKIEVLSMPIITTKKASGAEKNEVNTYELGRIMHNYRKHVTRAFIEEVNATPQMGVTSAFNFGGSFMAVRMAVAAHFIPATLVRAEVWKAYMKVTADKETSRALASQLFPKYAACWSKKSQDGAAEAVLIAKWGVDYGYTQ